MNLMKRLNRIAWLFYITLFVSCNSGSTKADKNAVSDSINDRTKTELIISKDSTLPESKPTHQEIYSEEWKRDETMAKLKFDPSTKIKNFNYKLNDNGYEVRIELYYINDRIVTVEKRIFDKDNDQLTLTAFDFVKDNECNSMTQWKKEDRMSYIYSMYGDSLIKYDVNGNKMSLNSLQKQKFIQSAKATLDSTMQHFQEFKYTFNWK